MIVSSKSVMTSSAIPIVTVSRSGNAVVTYTSTSYSSYQTTVPTLVSSDSEAGGSSPSNTGAIVGGVVGGLAGIALIGNYYTYKNRGDHRKEIVCDTSLSNLTNFFVSRIHILPC